MNTVLGRRLGLLLTAVGLMGGCSDADRSAAAFRLDEGPTNGQLFTAVPTRHSGVRFENRLADDRDLNVFTYRNYYNGGGVAVGDLTGDDLPEVLLASNRESNRLYVNEGEFRFRDVTKEAGVAGKGSWTTGVTFADVNGDGLLDIYVCYAGDVDGEKRANELYVHQGVDETGVPRFQEMAAAYGIADRGYATHAAFFDYDRDGLLDLYLVNNSPRPVSSFGLRNVRHVRHDGGGDKLYRNLGERFVDVSEAAGIYGSEIAFGLGVAVGDVNRDGWPDIYVSNDFFERDYLYVNQRDGTFAEVLDQQMPSISYSSMGLDIADINNDGWLDIYVADMLPEDEYRLKMTLAYESWDIYQIKLKHDYHHQHVRNTLQLNNGNGTFSEIGQLAGVDRTDWSWSTLIADYDLDGYKDIHVTTGIARDLTSQDYISYLSDDETIALATKSRRVDYMRLIRAMGTTELPDYGFRNDGDLTFSNAGAAWGLNSAGFSNGAAYGDLDGDGALDLVVNRLNQPAAIYRNNARALLHHRYLQVELVGEGHNRFAVGARVALRGGEQSFVQELMPSRGFQSSVDYLLTFGLGGLDTVESVTVEWPDGRVSMVYDVPANQRMTVHQSAATAPPTAVAVPAPLFADVTDAVALPYVHRENDFVDFHREPLMPKLLSTEGPYLAMADVNGDGLDDVFIGGAKDQPGQLLVQQRTGAFVSRSASVFERDRISEDLGAVFFDATGDGHPDLYVVSGGSEFSDLAPALQDRLYLNDGRGDFRKAAGHLPSLSQSGSRAVAHDFDADGDLDLFVGGRVIPWRYGIDPPSVLLANDGRGRFSDVTQEVAPELAQVGMVTDALWHDVDADGLADLVVVGEWMPITVFRNSGAGTLSRMDVAGLEQSQGWWNRIVAGDFTGDGRTDFVVANLGLNTRLRATAGEPLTMYVKDFDGNGFPEQIVAVTSASIRYPLVLRDDLLEALPFLEERYPNYESYARQSVEDVFGPEGLDEAVLKEARTLATTLVTNMGDGSFALVPLPPEAQVAPVYGVLADDVDGDGDLDLLLAGNFDGVKPEVGRMGAGYGLYLRADGGGAFTPVAARESGWFVSGQARDIQRIRTARGDFYMVTRNNDRPLVFRVTSPAASS